AGGVGADGRGGGKDVVMGITVYCTTDEQQAAAEALAQGVRAELADLGSTVDVLRLADAGVGGQDLPLTVMQVMALKGADTFPLTLVGDNAARSGDLPTAADLRYWAAEGLTESLPLVTDAANPVEVGGASRGPHSRGL